MIQLNNTQKQHSIHNNKHNNNQKQVIPYLFNFFNPKNVIPTTQQISHQLQSYLQIQPKQRQPSLIKNIKSSLHQLECFKFPSYLRERSPEMEQMFNNEHKIIINMLSQFVELQKYGRGQIIEITGMKRDYIRILLGGKVAIFTPVNAKSKKNSYMKAQNKQFNLKLSQDVALLQKIAFNKIPKDDLFDINQFIMNQTFLTDRRPQQLVNSSSDQSLLEYSLTNYNESSVYLDNKQVIIDTGAPLSTQQAQKILVACNIITFQTPHSLKETKTNQQMISYEDQPFFIDQKQRYSCCAVCLTECTSLQIEYSVAEQIIKFVANNRQKTYLKALLFSFPMLKYHQISQYLNPQLMISQQNHYNDEINELRASYSKNNFKSNSSKFKIQYTNELYLIAKGKVSLFINLINQKKTSNIEHGAKRVILQPKQILTLTNNDIFGLQELGKITKLIYAIQDGSEILKMDQLIVRQHSYINPKFEEYLNNIFQKRNRRLKFDLQRMQRNLYKQELQRYGNMIQQSKIRKKVNELQKISTQRKHSLFNIEQFNELPPIKQLKFYGHQNFQSVKSKILSHFSPQKNIKPKEHLSVQLVNSAGLGIQFSKNLVLRKGETFQIKSDYIQVRSKNGRLIRKKKIQQNSEIQEKNSKKKKDEILHKLGIMSTKQIADHNLKIVKRRKSQYEFQDITTQSKQIKRIKNISKSLPKLTTFFSKKQDKLFNAKTHIKYY